MMEKVFKPAEAENRIYQMWEGGGYFTSKMEKGKKPFSIILPPPNANADLHLGHALYTIQDILIRFHRMRGEPTLWLPGADHAGFETQVVYEKSLAKEGKSRFDFDRQTLYQDIYNFVLENRRHMQDQLRRLGYSLDWSRDTLTIDPHVVKTVYETFRRMHVDGLVYRSDYLVNYCPKCGTTFAELEIDHVERIDPLYYMKYGPFTLATVRPETKFGDTAVAVNPHDRRYRRWIGQEIEVEGLLGAFKMRVIGDDFVDPQFGTGVVKVTPAHDKNDYEAGKRHRLEIRPVLDLAGRLNGKCGPYAGLKVKEAREKVVRDLAARGLLVKVDENYRHTVAVCYKGGHDIEPTVLPNWFIKVEPLKKLAVAAVKSGQTKIFPQRFTKVYFAWMGRMHDWPISRQIVWGIRIPVWYDVRRNPNLRVEFLDQDRSRVTGAIGELIVRYRLAEIEEGLQRVYAPIEAVYEISPEKPGDSFLPETDTFDTWFSSGQWPLVTLRYPDGQDYEYFYPTTVMETGYDILEFWVSRMMMFGLYLTGKVPFENVYLHGLVRDAKGQKMSKSKGNVINPMDLIEKYGADAVRMSLIIGVGAGSDQNLSEEKMKAMRNFANKVWNISRFILGEFEKFNGEVPFYSEKMESRLEKEDKEMLKRLDILIKSVTTDIDAYRFGQAAEDLYQFVWHEFADQYIEESKARLQHPDPGSGSDNGGLPDSIRAKQSQGDDADRLLVLSLLRHVLINSLKLLHPFMPFITEAVWQQIPRKRTGPLIVSSWPNQG